MPAAFRSSSATTYATRTNTTLTAPAGLVDADNLLLVFVIGASTLAGIPTPAAPAGFSLLTGFPISVSQNNDAGQFSVKTYVWRKVASGDSGDYTVSHSSASTDGYLCAVSGGTTGALSPNPSVNDGDGTGNMTALSLTPTVDASLIVWAGHNWQLFGGHSPPTGTTPTFTERNDSASSILYVCDGVLATAAATGDKAKASGNLSAEDQWAATMICIAAAGGRTTKNAHPSGLGMQHGMGLTLPNGGRYLP